MSCLQRGSRRSLSGSGAGRVLRPVARVRRQTAATPSPAEREGGRQELAGCWSESGAAKQDIPKITSLGTLDFSGFLA